MKKLYSLAAAFMIAASVNAQTTVFSATFDDVDGTGGNDGGWSGTVAGTAATAAAGWSYDSVYKGAQCLKAGTGSKAGSITTPVLTELSGNATLTFRAGAWNGASEKLNLKIAIQGGGSLDVSTVTLSKGSFTTYTVQITGGTATSKLTFSSETAANNRFFIDDIIVTAATMATVDANASKASLVKNTIVSNNIMFGTKADIQIINMNGQVVKTASVSADSKLDVSSLAKGIYVVTGVINGKAVSQKIVKK